MADFGWHYPPGVTESMIPGNRPEDAAWERFLESVPAKCPHCGQPTMVAGKHWDDFAPYVSVDADAHAPEVRCMWENAEGDPCEELLARALCGCPDCDPRDSREDWDRDDWGD